MDGLRLALREQTADDVARLLGPDDVRSWREATGQRSPSR